MHGKFPGWHQHMYPGVTVYTKVGRPDLPRIRVGFDDIYKVPRTVGDDHDDFVPFATFEAAETYWAVAFGGIPKPKAAVYGAARGGGKSTFNTEYMRIRCPKCVLAPKNKK